LKPSGTSDRRFEQRVGGRDLPRVPETEPRKGAFRRTGSKAVRRGVEVAGQERRTWRGGSERDSRFRRAKGRREASASPETVPRTFGAMIRNGVRAVAGSKERTCRRLTVPCSGCACRLANELLTWVSAPQTVPLTYGRALGGNPVGKPSGRSRWESPVGERRPASKEHGSPAVMRGALQGEHIARRWLRPNERERTGAE
jgi:hypothetical protein